MKLSLRTYIPLISFVLFVAAVTALLLFIEPQRIVQSIGVKNSYVVTFLVASIGGLSSLTGLSFFAALATFSTGGASPWILGLAGGAGLFISDTIFFFLARYGRKSVPPRWEAKIGMFASWCRKLPVSAVLVLVFAYIGFTPLPNDLLMIALALTGLSYAKLAPAVFAGSITIATVVAGLARVGILLT